MPLACSCTDALPSTSNKSGDNLCLVPLDGSAVPVKSSIFHGTMHVICRGDEFGGAQSYFSPHRRRLAYYVQVCDERAAALYCSLYAYYGSKLN